MSSPSTGAAGPATANALLPEPRRSSALDTSSRLSPTDSRWRLEISSDDMKQIRTDYKNVEKAISEAFQLFKNATKLFGFFLDFKNFSDMHKTPISKTSWSEVSGAITQDLHKYRKLVEANLIPLLAPIREKYRGYSFTRTKETPKSLLLIAVPKEKVDRVPSFDTLKHAATDSCKGIAGVQCTAKGDGRFVLVRGTKDEHERFELVYRGPYKVDLYINGERRGGLWNDEAVKLTKRFAEGKPIKFKKDKKYTEYTVV